MEITFVEVKKVEKEDSNVRGFVTIHFDDCFAVHDIRIIEGKKGLFVAMPNKKTKYGNFRDVAHPLNRELREKVHDAVLEEYNKIK